VEGQRDEGISATDGHNWIEAHVRKPTVVPDNDVDGGSSEIEFYRLLKDVKPFMVNGIDLGMPRRMGDD
jgi:hypothetical protein